MIDEIKRRGALANRKKFIEDLKNIPSDIKNFHKANKKLTTCERFMSGFLQTCIRYGYVKSYRTQQIIQMGVSGNYIMPDFLLSWPEVIIEVDGPEHDSKIDSLRDAHVRDLFAYETLRVSNNDIVNNNLATRKKLIKGMAEAEGLSPKKVKERMADYLRRQKMEGLI